MHHTDTPHRPDIHVAPPLVFLAGFGVAVLIDRLIHPWWLVGNDAAGPALAVAGVALALLGIALALWGVVTFRRARTSVLPFRPATAMVRAGPYRFTRNPMYVGMTLGYLGAALVIDSWWPVVLLPLVLVALVRLVIRREEEYLAAVFGTAYEEYRRSVRRWL